MNPNQHWRLVFLVTVTIKQIKAAAQDWVSTRRRHSSVSLIVSSGSKCFQRNTPRNNHMQETKAGQCHHLSITPTSKKKIPRVTSVKLKCLCSHLWCHRTPTPPPVPAFFSWPPLKRESERECAREECAHATEKERGREARKKADRAGGQGKSMSKWLFVLFLSFLRVHNHLSHVT